MFFLCLSIIFLIGMLAGSQPLRAGATYPSHPCQCSSIASGTEPDVSAENPGSIQDSTSKSRIRRWWKRSISGKGDRGAILSTLWISTTLNYLYADLMGFMDMNMLAQYLTGTVNGITMTGGFLIGAALFMQIPIMMIFLSRVLKRKGNRRANIIAGIIMTVVQAATLLVGVPTGYYLVFSLIEIAATLFITWYAWKWPREDVEAVSTYGIK